jgi:hypothetical protein
MIVTPAVVMSDLIRQPPSFAVCTSREREGGPRIESGVTSHSLSGGFFDFELM